MNSSAEFKCIFCHESFSDKETLQIHFRKHGDPNFNQGKGKTKVTNETNLPSDSTDEHAEMISCDICPETFLTISRAITHKHKVHPDHDTKHFCPWCGKLFTMKHLYNKHMQTNHTDMTREDNKNFHCNCCNINFYIPTAMLHHNKFFHRQDTDLPSVGSSKKLKLINQESLQIYYCPFCGDEYDNKVNLHKHITDEHNDENQRPDEVLRCPLCDAIFYHWDAYEVHITFHSCDDLYFEKNEMMNDLTEFSLETVPPNIEKNCDREDDVETTINSMGVDQFLQLAMDDTSNEMTKKSKKHKKSKKSKKAAITLDEFLSMNQDVFGEGLDFQGIEEVPRQEVAQKLKNTKKARQKPTVAAKITSSNLERLKKQGIVVKKKPAATLSLPQSNIANLSHNKLQLPNKANPILKSLETSLDTSSDVLTKLMNQSNQIRIVKKSVSEPKDTDQKIQSDEISSLTENKQVNPETTENNDPHKDTTSESEMDEEVKKNKLDDSINTIEQIHEKSINDFQNNTNSNYSKKVIPLQGSNDDMETEENNEANSKTSPITIPESCVDTTKVVLDEKVDYQKSAISAIKHLSSAISVKSVSQPNADQKTTDVDLKKQIIPRNNNQNKIPQCKGNVPYNKKVEALKYLGKNITIKTMVGDEIDSTIKTESNSDNDMEEEYLHEEEQIFPNINCLKLPAKTSKTSNETSFNSTNNTKSLANTDLLKKLKNVTAKPMNTKNIETESNTKRTVVEKQSNNNKALIENVEVFNIDDSDSDDMNNDESVTGNKVINKGNEVTNTVHINKLQKLGNNITIKTSSQKSLIDKPASHNKQNIVRENCESALYDSDGDITLKSNLAIKTALKNIGKGITIKSKNSSQSLSTKLSCDTNAQDESDSDTDTYNVKITEMENDNKSDDEFDLENFNADVYAKQNAIVESPDESYSENENDDWDLENHTSNSYDQETEHTQTNKCMNSKLKTISKDITIKPLNEKSTHGAKPEHPNIKNKCSEVLTSQNKKIKRNKNLCQQEKVTFLRNQCPTNMQSNNKVDKNMSTSNQMNTINKEVTVKSYHTQNNTVIEEVTTTVTKTIRTVNQMTNQEYQFQSSVEPTTNHRFQGPPRANRSCMAQGISLRNTSPGIGQKIMPCRPMSMQSTRQTVPVRSSVKILSSTSSPRMPLKKPIPSSSSTIGRTIKISPNAIIPSAMKRHNTDEEVGPFSHFKKPKESLIPVDGAHSRGSVESRPQIASITQTSRSNVTSTSKSMKDNSFVTSMKVKTETCATSQHVNKLGNMSGLKIMKTSQAKETVVQDTSEMNSPNWSTLEAIEKLKRQGLLINKPRDDVEENEWSDPDSDNEGYCSEGENE